MNFSLRLSILLAIITYFLIIMYLLKNKSLTLRYTLVWIISGLCMLLVVLFPDMMTSIAKYLGIAEVPNALFALCLFFLLIISITLTSIISKMADKNRQLIQHCALLDRQIRELHNKLTKNVEEKQASDKIY